MNGGVLLSVFRWCEGTALAHAINDSVWLFPAISAVHLLALAILGGAVLVVDFRLLGFGLTTRPVSQLARDLQPWLSAGVIGTISSGLLMFISEATRCYFSRPFWLKMGCLALVLLFTGTIRHEVIHTRHVRLLWRKLAAILSITLWLAVAVLGRAIGLIS